MFRLTITVVADDKSEDRPSMLTLAEKLEQVADDLRHDPSYGSFGSYGSNGCNLYYRIQEEDDLLEDDLLSVRPILMAR